MSTRAHQLEVLHDFLEARDFDASPNYLRGLQVQLELLLELSGDDGALDVAGGVDDFLDARHLRGWNFQ